MMTHRFFLLIVAFLFVVPISCGTGAAPRQQIEKYIAEVEGHFEKRRSAKLRHFISPDYRDEYTSSRKELLRIAAGYILRHPSIHIIWKMRSLSLEQDTAEATIVVAVSPTAVSEDDIRLAQAEFHRLRLDLVKEEGWFGDDWLLQSLGWQRIDFEEFM